MLSNSHVWKRELKKELQAFKKFIAKTDIREAADNDYLYLKIEKFFFITSFIIRKLYESHKLSEELVSINISVERYKRIDAERRIHLFNNSDLFEFYDFTEKTKASLGAMKLCNCFIHSFNFGPVFQKGEKALLVGVYINSDNDKDTFLYYVKLEAFINFVQNVIDDYITFTHYDSVKDKYKRTRKPMPMPDEVKEFLRENPDPRLHEIMERLYGSETSL